MGEPLFGRFCFSFYLSNGCVNEISCLILVADRMIDILPKHAFWSLCIMQWNA